MTVLLSTLALSVCILLATSLAPMSILAQTQAPIRIGASLSITG